MYAKMGIFCLIRKRLSMDYKICNYQYGILSLSLNVNPRVILGFTDETNTVTKNDQFTELMNKLVEKANEDKIIIEILDVWMMLGIQNFVILFRTNGKIDTVMSIVESWIDEQKFNKAEAHTIDFSGYCTNKKLQNIEGFIDYIKRKYNKEKNCNGDEIVKILKEITKDSPYKLKKGEYNLKEDHKCWKRIKVTEFSCDMLIPVFLQEEYEENLGTTNEESKSKLLEKISKRYTEIKSQKPTMIMYLRIYRVPLNNGVFTSQRPGNQNGLNSCLATPQNILDTFLSNLPPEMEDQIKAIFFGYGLYDLIIIFETKSYNEIEYIANTIRVKFEIFKKTGKDKYHAVNDSSMLLSCPLGGEKISVESKKYDFLNISIILRIWAGYEKPDLWEKVKKLAEIMEIGEPIKINDELVNPCINSRQGFYDYIIIIQKCRELHKYVDFLTVIESLLPFVQGVITLIRYPYEIGYYEDNYTKDKYDRVKKACPK
jgi:hypothetical protein